MRNIILFGRIFQLSLSSDRQNYSLICANAFNVQNPKAHACKKSLNLTKCFDVVKHTVQYGSQISVFSSRSKFLLLLGESQSRTSAQNPAFRSRSVPLLRQKRATALCWKGKKYKKTRPFLLQQKSIRLPHKDYGGQNSPPGNHDRSQ